MRTQASRYLEFFELVENSPGLPDEPYRVEGEGQFVLGYAEERLTLFSQQVRALNLAYSLNCVGRLVQDTRLLIVGAGPAGVTLAAAARLMGAGVTLLERAPHAMAMFAPKGVGGRYIQPLASEWPEDRSIKRVAGLPICSWSSGDGQAIANDIRDGLRAAIRTAQALGNNGSTLRCFYNVDHLQISARRPSRGWSCSWNSTLPLEDDLLLAIDGKTHAGNATVFHEKFDIIIFAFGPGRERSWKDGAGNDHMIPYFSAASDVSAYPESLIVSGPGDGGLIDVILHRTGKSHSIFMSNVELAHSESSGLRSRLLSFERDISVGRRTIDIIDGYEDILKSDSKSVDQFFDSVFGGMPMDRKTTLLARDGEWLHPKAQPLHRFCCWLLKHRGKLNVQSGPLDDALLASHTRVSVRHGPVSIDDFSTRVMRTLRAQMKGRSELDLTRSPIWPDGFFPAVPNDPGSKTALPFSAGPVPSSITRFNRVTSQSRFEPMDKGDTRGWIRCRGTDSVQISSMNSSGRFFLDHEARAVDGARLEILSGTLDMPKGEWTFEIERGRAHAIPETSMAYSVTGKPGHGCTLQLEWEANPYGPFWCRDGYGYPVYSDMHIEKLLLEIQMDRLVPFTIENGVIKQNDVHVIESHFRRRDYSEIDAPIPTSASGTPKPVLSLTATRSSGGKISGTSIAIEWEKPRPGIFHMIMWDGLILLRS